MKVMHINAVYGVGSTGVIVEDLHNLAFDNGIESYVAYSTTKKNPADIKNGYAIGGKTGKKIHSAFCRIGGKQGYFSRFATFRLLRHIKKVKPDIVHLHNLHSNYIHVNMLLDFLGKNDIETIVSLHDCWFYTGGCYHYTATGCNKWLDTCKDCPKNNANNQKYLKKHSAKILADRKKYFGRIKKLTLVGVSEWISQEAAKTFFKENNIVTIHNGIDTSFFVPTESDYRERNGLQDKFVILAPGSKWLRKENEKTFDYVTQNLPEDCVILVLGCWESRRDTLPSNMIPLEWIRDREEIKRIFSASDVFANCSREESLSLINVEAQASGTPVVTYRNTGVQETVDNKCGFSVENGNEKEFFDAIMEIKRRGKAEFSEDCCKWVKKRFDRDENYMKYINLYKSRGIK
ncbi:MAG: glycosyltransferase [Ruminococcaceae bacterium]|nr:glycosyltransferase [Oscillospiraceae bacterium]